MPVACSRISGASDGSKRAVKAVPPQDTHKPRRKWLLMASSSAQHTVSQSHSRHRQSGHHQDVHAFCTYKMSDQMSLTGVVHEAKPLAGRLCTPDAAPPPDPKELLIRQICWSPLPLRPIGCCGWRRTQVRRRRWLRWCIPGGYPLGRPRLGVLLPHLTAHEELLLPDRHLRLQLVDGPVARLPGSSVR